MAVAHNAIIRGLNSVYKQAPHVASRDRADFISYAHCWADTLISKSPLAYMDGMVLTLRTI